ncbi:MAG: hypothetical protein KY457_08160 [Actinobacteria bacterium]|nr:hypothetical protein [Actinomycetota bacterium]
MRTAKSSRRANGGTDPTPRRRTTRILAGLAAGSLIAAVAPTASLPTDEPEYAATTTVEVDREGIYLPTQTAKEPSDTAVAEAVRPSIARCGTDYDCFRYDLVLPGGRRSGERLRFGIDYRQAFLERKGGRPRYDVVLLDADGTELTRAAWSWETRELQRAAPVTPPWGDPPVSLADSHGHLEAFLDDPTDPTYVAVVIASSISSPNRGFQARVKLDPPYRSSNGRGLLLPDLEPLVPYELMLNPVDGCVGLDDPEQNAGLPCDLRLRFSYGYRNAGEGPLRIEFEPLADGGIEGDAVQRLFWPPSQRDEYELERSVTREAGTYHLHEGHQHYHYDPMYSVELYTYEDGTRSREPVSETPKVGNCGHDWFMTDFATSFEQDPRGAQDSDGCVGESGSLRFDRVAIGLSAGWGDTYSYATGDSYVPFATQGADGTWQRLEDGEYLLVQRVNIDHALLEQDVTDNVGYTHLRVDGSTVCIIERGLGESPLERTAAEPLAWPTCRPA